MEQSGRDGSDVVVTDNPARSRYEVHVGGQLAGFVNYRLQDPVIDLIHTEVEDGFQGAGLAGRLARASLDDARARHLTVKPTCPYIRSWLGKHPDYQDLLPDGHPLRTTADAPVTQPTQPRPDPP